MLLEQGELTVFRNSNSISAFIFQVACISSQGPTVVGWFFALGRLLWWAWVGSSLFKIPKKRLHPTSPALEEFGIFRMRMVVLYGQAGDHSCEIHRFVVAPSFMPIMYLVLSRQ